MPHFRFQAKTTEGKLIQREFEAPSKSDAKKKVNQAASARSLRVQALDEKKNTSIESAKTGSLLLKESKRRTVRMKLKEP